MAISTNPKPTIYRNLYENTAPGPQPKETYKHIMYEESGVFIMYADAISARFMLDFCWIVVTKSVQIHNRHVYKQCLP